MTLQSLAEVTVWEIFASAWLFVALHTVLCLVEGKPWWRSPSGWLLTAAAGSFAVVFSFLAAMLVYPRLALLPWFVWTYVLSFQAIAAVFIGLIILRIWLHAHLSG